MRDVQTGLGYLQLPTIMGSSFLRPSVQSAEAMDVTRRHKVVSLVDIDAAEPCLPKDWYTAHLSLL